MKIQIFALGLLATALALPAVAQIQVTIPQNAIRFNQTSNPPDDNNATYWLCNSGSATFDGNNNTVYVDDNTGLRIDGNNNTIYTRGTMQIVVNGNNNEIYTNGAPVRIDGNNNQIFYPAGTQVEITNGNNNTRNVNLGLVFNYGLVGGQGCNSVTSTQPAKATALLQFGPNPAPRNGTLYITTQGQNAQGPITLQNVSGQHVRQYPAGSATLGLQGLPAGVYYVRYTVGGQPGTTKIVVE